MNVVRSENVGKRVIHRPRHIQERLKTFLKLFGHDETVLILIYPEPDSMASALTVKRLLWKRVRSPSIIYIGKIQRLENQARIPLEILREEGVSGDTASMARFVKDRLKS